MLRGDDEMEALLAEMGGDTPSTTNVSTTTNIDTTTYQSSSTTNINKNNNNNNNSHHESSNRLKKRNQNKRSRQNKSTKQQQHLTTTTATTTLNDYNFAETRLLDDPLKWPQRGGFQLTSSLLNPSSCSQWTSKNNNNDYNYSGTCSTCGTSPAHHLMIHVPQPQYNNKKSHYYKRPKKRSYHHHHHSDINVLLPRIFVNLRNMRCLCGEYSSSSSSSSFLKSLNSFRQTLTSLLQQLASAKDISEGNVSYLTEPMTDLENAMNELETTATKQEKREFVTREMQWRIMIQLDLIYYRLYYIILTTTTSSSSSSSSRPPVILFIPHPATYFSCHGMAGNVTAGYEALERFLPRLNDETRMLLLDTWGLGDGNDDDDSDNNNNDNNDNNPLHTLWKHRFLETIRHFWDSGYVQSHSTASIFRSLTTNPHPKKRRRRDDSHYDEALSQHETTALSPLLSSWRDASRDTPASYYAYATPSPTALKMITTAVAGKRVVEWGAGTGYWAALLQRKGVSVEAYDIAPTTTTTTQGGDVNEYHGCVPSFTTVWKGNVNSSLDQRRDDDDDDDDVLMLCYPPPDNEMATEALLRCSNRRTMVIHIGEWRGLTGTRQFEQLLMANYDCVNDISLPVWGTDAASLTIWKKRQQQQQLPTTSSSSLSSSLSVTKSLFGAAACCFRQNCTTMAQKRCRLARVLAYCSKECFEMRGEDERRRSIMALYMLHVPSSAAAADDGSSAANKKEKEGDGTRTTVTTANDWLDFCNEGHFLDIGGSHASSRDERDGTTTRTASTKKKRKKGRKKNKV